jgi:hypothetical protein
MMDTIKKSFFGILIVLFLVLSAFCVNADTQNDISNDVYHYRISETGWSWEKSVSDKPDIDIVEISYSTMGDELTLNMKVRGDIVSSENVIYWAFYNSSDSAYYFSWSDGQGFGIATSIDETSGSYDFDPDVSSSGDTITAVFDVIGSTDNVALWGWAAEYTVIGDQSSEWWGDWAPSEYAPFWGEDIDDGTDEDDDGEGDDVNGDDNQNDTVDDGDSNGQNSNEGTPGFGFIVFIAAIAAILVFYRKYR